MSTVYLSSTDHSRKGYYAAALSTLKALPQIDLVPCATSSQSTFAERLAAIAACDLYICLIGSRDDTPPSDQHPITQKPVELEYRQAITHNKPCLIFLLADVEQSPFIESQDAESLPTPDERIQHLREELIHTQTGFSIQSPQHLVSVLTQSVLEWQAKQHSSTPSLQDDLARLPYWWRATLLRCSLQKPADRYPPEAFGLLLRQGRLQEVLDIIDTLRNPVDTVQVLRLVTNILSCTSTVQEAYAERCHQLLTKAYVLARMLPDTELRHHLLVNICASFARLQQWQRAEAVISILKDNKAAALAWGHLCVELARAGERERAVHAWEKARLETHNIEIPLVRFNALYRLGGILKRAYREQWAAQSWQGANQCIGLLEEDTDHAPLLRQLDEARASFARELVQGNYLPYPGQTPEDEGALLTMAKALAHAIHNPAWKARTLFALGTALARQNKVAEAGALWDEAENRLLELEKSAPQVTTYGGLAVFARLAEQKTRAERYWIRAIDQLALVTEPRTRVLLQWELGVLCAEAALWPVADMLWKQAEEQNLFTPGYDNAGGLRALAGILNETDPERARETALSIQRTETRDGALSDLVQARISASDWDGNWQPLKSMLELIEDNELRVNTLQDLGTALAERHRGEEAEALWQEASILARIPTECAARATAFRELARALTVAGQPASGLWQHAERMTHLIADPATRAEALRQLGMALTANPVSVSDDTATQGVQIDTVWDAAETAACLVRPDWVQANLLRLLSVTLARAGHWERAEAVAMRIENAWAGHSEALRELVSQLVHAQQWKRAADVAYRIAAQRIRADVLQELSDAFLVAQQWHLVPAVARMIAESETRARVFCALGCARMQAQEPQAARDAWDEATQIAHTIKANHPRAAVLRDLASVLHQHEGPERAEPLWQEAESTIRAIEVDWLRTVALGQLGLALARAQQPEHAQLIWRQAETAARQLKFDRDQAEALAELATIQAQARQQEQAEALWHEAETLAGSIPESQVKVNVQRVIVTSLLRAQQWELAERVAQKIEGIWASRDETLHDLATQLTRIHKWEPAEKAIAAIKELRIKAEALRELGRALSQADLPEHADRIWQEAEHVARSISPATMRVEALRKLGIALMQSQHPERARTLWLKAETTALLLEDPQEKATMLQKLVETYASVDAHEQIAHLLQRAWSSAETRIAALQLLPLVTPLITLRPEIGLAFFESFDQVDTLLSPTSW